LNCTLNLDKLEAFKGPIEGGILEINRRWQSQSEQAWLRPPGSLPQCGFPAPAPLRLPHPGDAAVEFEDRPESAAGAGNPQTFENFLHLGRAGGVAQPDAVARLPVAQCSGLALVCPS